MKDILGKLAGNRSQLIAVIAFIAIVAKSVFNVDLNDEQQQAMAGALIALYGLFMALKLERGVKP
jgi:hypothetical protein